MTAPAAPSECRCVKCGSSDTHTKYVAKWESCAHSGEPSLWPNVMDTPDLGWPRFSREALLRTCRCCGYRWVDDPLDALAPKGD